jgi:hypothetical protein
MTHAGTEAAVADRLAVLEDENANLRGAERQHRAELASAQQQVGLLQNQVVELRTVCVSLFRSHRTLAYHMSVSQHQKKTEIFSRAARSASSIPESRTKRVCISRLIVSE